LFFFSLSIWECGDITFEDFDILGNLLQFSRMEKNETLEHFLEKQTLDKSEIDKILEKVSKKFKIKHAKSIKMGDIP